MTFILSGCKFFCDPCYFKLMILPIFHDKQVLLISLYAAAAATSLQSCPTLCNPIHGSPLGSAVPGILQARTLEWVAISFSNAGKWKVKVKSLSCARLLATPWTAAYQTPPSMGFSRQEYWSELPLLSPFVIWKSTKYFKRLRMKLEMKILWYEVTIMCLRVTFCQFSGISP